MKFIDKGPALILVDLQKAFFNEEYWGGNRNNKDAEGVCAKILEKWRQLDLPLFHIRHSSSNVNSIFHESKKEFEFIDTLKPKLGEQVITKKVNSAFIGTNLQEQLDEMEINTLVIIGLTTDHCVSTTTRMAGNYGYKTYVISDATATFDRKGVNNENFDSSLIHSTTLASLNNEFATVWNSEELFKAIEEEVK